MFREVRVYEIREVLRLWLRGKGLRSIERLSSVDRKTVRRYVTAAVEAGLDRAGGEEQLDDVLLAAVCEAVRPHRPDGHGAAWAVLVAHHDQLKAWVVTEGLTAVKAHELLGRQGVVVPERTLHRYAEYWKTFDDIDAEPGTAPRPPPATGPGRSPRSGASSTRRPSTASRTTSSTSLPTCASRPSTMPASATPTSSSAPSARPAVG